MENWLSLGVLLILALSSVSMMAYYWYFNRQVRELGTFERKTDGSEASWEALHGAIKKSEAIIGEAEIEGAKVVAESRLRSDRLEQKAEEGIDSTAAAVQRQILAESAKASAEFKEYLRQLRAESADGAQSLREVSEEKMETMLSQIGKAVSARLAEIEEESIKLAEADVAAMRRAVEEYRTRRIEAIDNESVAIFNKAIALILKDMPLSTHIDIIKKSIEQAKAEHFIN